MANEINLFDTEDEVYTPEVSNTNQSSAPINNVDSESQGIFYDFRDVNIYRFLKDMYYGTGGVSGKTGTRGRNAVNFKLNYGNKYDEDTVYSYLTPNPTEHFYLTRVRKSAYTNHFRRYIDSKYMAVFKSPPVTTVSVGGVTLTDHPYIDYTNNVNGAGMSKNQLFQNLMGSVFRDEVAFLIKDKREGSTQPHSYIQTADSVETYDTDEYGNLISITFVNQMPNGSYMKNEWHTDLVRVYSSDDCTNWKLIKETPITHLPILAVFAHPRTDVYDYLPKPKSYPIASLNLNIYEAESIVDWLIEKQGHDTMYVVGFIEGVREGLTNIMQIENTEGGSSVGIVSPDANKVTVQQARIQQKLDNLFDLMLDGGVMVSRMSSPESGYSKEYTFTPVNDALLHTTQILSSVDVWFQNEYKYYMGGGDFTATTHYKKNFFPKPKASQMELKDIMIDLEDRGLVDNAKAILKMRLLDIHDNKLDIEDLLTEIDDNYIGTGFRD